MKVEFLRILPRRTQDGFLIMKDGVIAIECGKRVYVNHASAKLSYRPFELNIRWPISFQLQLHINEYGVGDLLAAHKDHILDSERQYRIQFVTRNATKGGVLLCKKFITNLSWFKVFEPCKWEHEVTVVEEGQRRVWNFGIRFAFKYLSPSPI